MKNLIIGIGNQNRGDDAVAFLVTENIRKRNPLNVMIVDKETDAASLIEMWKDANAVVLVDAVHSSREPGTVFRFDVLQERLPATLFHGSTHDFGVAEAVELSRVLKYLPKKFVIYGIEGKNYQPGAQLSREARVAARAVESLALSELHSI